jgi:hypothetical protein
MSGKNYRQGYACRACINASALRADKRTPLYGRENQRYVFTGLVLCPIHGVEKAVPLRKGA